MNERRLKDMKCEPESGTQRLEVHSDDGKMSHEVS